MNGILRRFRDGFVSIKLTVGLIAGAILLVFAATLDQTNLGVWGVQRKWFHAFVVFEDVHGVTLPIFPGGYTIGGLLFLNLIAAHCYRFKFVWRQTGIWLTHAGLVMLLVGELLSGLWQEEYFMRLDAGATRNYAESSRLAELAITDTTDANFDDVVAVPATLLAPHAEIQHPLLPFRVATRMYYPNSLLQARSKAPAGQPAIATVGVGLSLDAAPQPENHHAGENNVPSAYVELLGPDGSLATFLVSTQLAGAQAFSYAGRTWTIALRAKRIYRPFSLTLLQFSHDRYAGTDIPKAFVSRVHLHTLDGRDDRDVAISMNHPLRYAGLTFYQAGFDNNDRTSVLQVVRNPSWLLPYVACSLMAAGLVIQFLLRLAGFVRRRAAAPDVALRS